MEVMWRFILRRLAPVLLTLSFAITPVWAQNRPADRMQYGEASTEPLERGPPVFQYTIAFLSIILVMLILCMPSRKRVAQ
jgi:hypothetical protein